MRRWIGALALLASVAILAHGDAPSDGRVAQPLLTSELRTTSSDIAAANLDASIMTRERELHDRPGDVAVAIKLIESWLERARFLDRLTDYARADELSEHLVAISPSPRTLRARASVRARLHRFSAALDDLDEAAAFDGRPDHPVAQSIIASILEARGQLDDAATLRKARVSSDASLPALGALATIEAKRGNHDVADQLSARAASSYRDVSPFAVAWLEVELARAATTVGNVERARAYFMAAQARLPHYTRATILHAELEEQLGDRRRAIALLEPLLAHTEDPEVAGHLSRLLAVEGDVERSRTLAVQAMAAMDALVTRHPEAFADHAAELRMQCGAEPTRTLELARLNHASRPTPDALRLLERAERAVDAQSER